MLLPLLLAAIVQRADAGAPPYWQQEVAYAITARLDEPQGMLIGHERIHYTNRSPDTLATFSLHFYLNAFRSGSRWADADAVEGRCRFNDLRDPDFAFNRVDASAPALAQDRGPGADRFGFRWTFSFAPAI